MSNMGTFLINYMYMNLRQKTSQSLGIQSSYGLCEKRVCILHVLTLYQCMGMGKYDFYESIPERSSHMVVRHLGELLGPSPESSHFC